LESGIPIFGEKLHKETDIKPIIGVVDVFDPEKNHFGQNSTATEEDSLSISVPIPGENLTSQIVDAKKTKHQKMTLKLYLESSNTFGLIINDSNFPLFMPYIKKISLLAQAFPNFEIKNLKNFLDYPLEDYDVEIDPNLSIEYLISQNKLAKSRWFNKDSEKFE
jgi:hypothetical protein